MLLRIRLARRQTLGHGHVVGVGEIFRQRDDELGVDFGSGFRLGVKQRDGARLDWRNDGESSSISIGGKEALSSFVPRLQERRSGGRR